MSLIVLSGMLLPWGLLLVAQLWPMAVTVTAGAGVGARARAGQGGEAEAATRAYVCPPRCSCPSEETVDCSGADLTTFPRNLPANIELLSLQNNRLETIPYDELSRLTKLRTLSLHHNQLMSQGLPDGAFESLQELEYLYLANNKLTAAPRLLPDTLRVVDLAANQLRDIFTHTFGHKPRLSSVYLHNNQLVSSSLPPGIFRGSDTVSILVLSDNNLTLVPPSLPPSLTHLHLQNNHISQVPEDSLTELLELRELHLQRNNLTIAGLNNHSFSSLTGLQYLDLSHNNLTAVPEGLPPSLLILHLGRNRISGVREGSLSGARGLQYLLLHNNALTADGIHRAAFDKLRQLHTLHVFGNRLRRVPPGLPRRLRSLMLLHNRIEGIGPSDFINGHFLTELNLSYNRLRSARVHRLAFRKLRRLHSLDLSGNRLTLLPVGLPAGLQTLKARRNHISQLEPHTLAGLRSLEELRLEHNSLTIAGVAPGSWQELPSLKLLDLGYNQLSYIPADLPESLENLYLQHNRIATITSSSFISTPNLKVLLLRSNRLTVAGTAQAQAALSALHQLQVLDLTSNPDHIDVRLNSDKWPPAGNSTARGHRPPR